MENATLVNQLAAEIQRVVSSPYPASLKSLHDTLILDKGGQALVEYAAENPCKVKALATCVADALERQQFAPDLLSKLCISDLFRVQLLTLRPNLLDLLINNATRGHDEYLSLSITLLRFKLPEFLALPASAEAFFMTVIKEATRNPSARSLSAAYSLLSGACSHLPQLLPQHEWSRIKTDLIAIVKSSRTIQDQSLSLLCLGILQLLAQQEAGTHVEGAHDASSFFVGSKALKTLSLAILQAVWVTKATHESSLADRLRSLDIVFNIVCVLPKDQVDGWSASNDGQAAILRLFKQTQTDAIHITIRLKLLSIVTKLFHGRSLPTRLLPELLTFVCDARLLCIDTNTFQCIEPVLTSLLSTSHADVLQILLRLIQQNERSTAFSALEAQNLGMMLKVAHSSLDQVTMVSESVCDGFYTMAKSVLDKKEPISSLHPTSGSSRPCLATMTNLRQTLRRDFVSLCLGMEVFASRSATNCEKNATARRLLQYLQKDTVELQCKCVNQAPIFSLPFALVAEPLSRPHVSGLPWRDNVRAFTLQQSQRQEQSLVEMITRMCGDLEDRCNIAEKPVREAEKKNEALQRRLLQLQSQNSDLAQEVGDLKDQMSMSEKENSHIRDMLQGENERLIDRVRSLEQALQDAKDYAQAQLERHHSESKAHEFSLRSAITEKEMLLDEITLERDDLHQRESEAAALLKNALETATDRAREYEQLQNTLSRELEEAKSLKAARDLLERNVQDLAQTQQGTEALLNTARDELRQCREQIEHLQSAHLSDVVQWEDRLRDESRLHAIAVDELQQGFAVHKSELENGMQQLRAFLDTEQATKEEIRRHFSEAKSLIHDQQIEIEQLQGDVIARDQEIADFQAMRQTLAATLGHPIEKKHSRKTAHYGPLVGRSPQQQRQSKVQDPKHGVKQLAVDYEADTRRAKSLPPNAATSFESVSATEGSTPKRAKPRKSFKVPIAKQPRLSNMVTPKSVKSRILRPPLEDISRARGNRSPARQILASPNKTQGRQEVAKSGQYGDDYAGLEELDFGSEPFTSTPFTPAGKIPCEVEDDDATVDEW